MKDEQPKMTTIEIPGIYGETDLKSTSPWFNSSFGWGDEWAPAFEDVTQESYAADPIAYERKVVEANEDYIEKLKREGNYLKPFVTTIKMKYNPLFDDPHPKQECPLESYQMLFLDMDAIPKLDPTEITYLQRGIILEYKPLNYKTMTEQTNDWKQYKRKGLSEMRPYIKGEDLSKISVSKEDDPETDLGMVARNPQNHEDQWYVARKYFNDNLEPA